MAGPLDGVRVIDLGTAIVGPWSGTLLGFLGADVIKIERPTGDRIRQQTPLQGGVSTTYTCANLNKRLTAFDVKDPALRPSIDRLVDGADVVLDNLRPGVIERMGLGFDAIRSRNPGIISASSPAWGEEGPLRGVPAIDSQVQMFSGFASLNGVPGGRHEMLRYPHLDINGACFFAAAIVLALLDRERTGAGLKVTASHLGSALGLQSSRIAEYLATNQAPPLLASGCAATAPHRYFQCQDRRYLAVGVETEPQWAGFCSAIQREDLAVDGRFRTNRDRVANREALDALLIPLLLSHPARWWAIRLEAGGVPYSYQHEFDELRFHQQILANDFIQTIQPAHQGELYVSSVPWAFSRTSVAINPEIPATGQQTAEVLRNGWGESAGPRPARPGADESVPHRENPLTGFRVVDASQGYAGPYAALLLAEAGAEVIKVEPPSGDYARGFAPSMEDGTSALFAAFNRNKQSIRLNLDTPEDRDRYRQIVQSADVVIEDWGPGVADRRGLGYDILSVSRPDLVYCALSAFGERGPLRDQPASELTAQAWGEFWKSLGEVGGQPVRVGADIVSVGAGAFTFLGILAALYHRVRTGEGQRIAVSLLGAAMSLRSFQWAALTNPDVWEGDTFSDNHIMGPKHGYQTADRPIYANFNKGTEEQFVTILAELGMIDEVIDDPRFANGGRASIGTGTHARECLAIWEKFMRDRASEEVVDIFNRNGGAGAQMRFANDVFDHPQVQTLNLVSTDPSGRRYQRAPWGGPWEPIDILPAPALDQDREAILSTVSGNAQSESPASAVREVVSRR